MFINPKDAPFAAVMAIALLATVRAFDEYPRAQPATIVLFGVGIGLAIGSRVMGGFAILNALLPLTLLVALQARRNGMMPALREAAAFLVPFIPAVILAYLVMGLVWPWSVTSPLNPFRAVEYFSNFFERPWRELFDGRVMLVPDMPRSYLPTLAALTLPEIMLVLGLGGMLGSIVAIVRGEPGQPGASARRRAVLLAVVLAALLPVLITIATRPAMYNGIRHFVFLTPPFAALGGLAAARLMQFLRPYGRVALAAATAGLAAGIALPIVDMVWLHPYQYTDFNHLAGGVAGARPRFMLDYWGLSIRQASLTLRDVIAERGETPTNPTLNPTWTVAVCGPHPAAVVALGPQYSAIWKPRGADFAITLGEFYCATLDAPVLFEVKREDVVYARVYDIRGRAIPSLLNVRGPDAGPED